MKLIKAPPLTPESMNQTFYDVLVDLVRIEDLLNQMEDHEHGKFGCSLGAQSKMPHNGNAQLWAESVQRISISNYVIIRLVTILEQFCREIIKYQIDHGGYKHKMPPRIEVNTAELDTITASDLEDETTLSARVASLSYSFQNTTAITNHLEDYDIRNIWTDDNLKKEIDDLTTNRHNVVHTVSNIDYDVERGYRAVEKLMLVIWNTIFEGESILHYNKGYALLDVNPDRAISCFDEAILRDTENIYPYIGKGHALMLLERYEQAIEYLDMAIELDPKHARTHSIKDATLLNWRKYEQAIVSFNEATRLEPASSYPHMAQGIALLSLGRSEEAIKCFDDAIRLEPDNSYLHYYKDMALLSLGRPDEAIKCFEDAIMLSPDDKIGYGYKDIVLSLGNVDYFK